MVTRIQGSPEKIQAELAKAVAAQSASMGPNTTAILILEPTATAPASPTDSEFDRLMAEALADAVPAGNVDDSREAIYTRMPGE